MSVSAFLLTAPSLSAQTVVAVTPTSTTLDSLLENSPVSQITDQSGLSSGYTSGTTTFATATTATHNNTSSTRWLSNGDTTGSMVFDLGDTFTLTSFALWNMASSSSQAVNGFTIETSVTSDFTSATTVLTSSASNSGVNSAAPSQNFSLTETDARYVRWNITSNKGNGTITAAGEVLFGGYLAAVSIFDAEVLSLMDRGGYSGDPTIYVLGENAAYDKTFSSAATLGSTKDYNQLLIQNGSVVDFASGQDQLTLDSDHNTVTVDDPGSSLTVATLTNNGTNNAVQVTDGGLVDADSLVMGDNADLNISIDGSSSSFQRDSVTLGTGATLSATVGNGGTYQVHDAVAETITLNDGGTLHVTSLDSASSFELDTLASLTFESGATIKSDVALSDDSTFTVSSGRTVDISGGGSFDSAFTLDGGTVAVNDFNLATDNLTFTSGSLDTSGTLTVGSDNSTQTISGVISGTGSLTKTGTSELTLTGANTYSGGTTTENGTLIGDTSSLQGDITHNGYSLQFDQSTDGTFAGNISGSGSFTKSGSGDLTLSGANSYSGGTTVSAGTLTGTTSSLTGDITNAAALVFDQDFDGSYTGELSGSGTLTTSGTGALTFSGDSSYTGTTTINSTSSVTLGHASAVGTGSIIVDGTLDTGSHGLDLTRIDAAESDGTISGSGTFTVDTDTNIDFGTQLTGTGDLTKSGTGTVSFGVIGANLDLSGDLTVNGGLVDIGLLQSGTVNEFFLNGGGLALGEYHNFDRAVELQSGGGTLHLSGNVSGWDGEISGTGSLTKTGDGELVLYASNTYSGGTTISGGTLTGTTSTLQGDITNNATLEFDQSTSGTFADIISGTGAVNITDSGNVTLSGNNTFSGTTTVADGTLTASHANALGATTAGTTVQSGATLALSGGNTFDAETITLNGTGDGGAGALANVSGDNSISAVTLASDSTIDVASGTTLTTTGSFTNNGLLTKTGDGRLNLTNPTSGSSTTITISEGTLQGNYSIFNTIASFTNNAELDFDADFDGTYSGVISGTGAFTKSGTGELTLSGSNTYSGGTTVSGGILIGTTTSLQGDITNNATLEFDQSTDGTFSDVISGTGSVTKSGTGNLSLSGTNTYSGGTTISDGTLTGTTATLQGNILNNAALVFDQDSNGTYAGVLSGTGSLTTTGTGSLIFSGNSSHSGSNTIDSNNTLTLGHANALGTGAIIVDGALDTGSHGLDLTRIDAAESDGTISGSGTFTVDTDTNIDFGTQLTGTGDLTKSGTGTVSFGVIGANLDLSGDLTVNGGLVDIGLLQSGTVNEFFLNGGGLALGEYHNFDRAVELQSGGGTLHLSGNVSGWDGEISGTGSLTKTGDGELVLYASNTYSGGTTISGGTLTGTTSTLQGDITNNATLEFDQSTSGTFADIISGTGAVNITDSGNVTLSGNNTFSGTTTVADGTLTASHANALGATTAGTTVQSGATLALSGGNTFDAETITLNGTGDGGAGALANVSGDNSISAVTLASDSTIDVASGTTLTTTGSFTNNGLLTKTGDGRLNLTNPTSGSSTTITISEGTLQGNYSIFNTIASFTNNAELDFDADFDGTYSGVISGTGAFTKSGTGELTLSGSNTYSGGTTVSGGILIGTTTSLQGDITNNATLEFDQSTDGTFSDVISGTGSVAKFGMGTVTLSGTNTYSGGTTISEGTLSAAPTNLGSGTITINGGTLSTTTFDGTGNTFTSGGLVASDSVTNLPTIASGMTVDLTGDGSFATATTLDGGTLATADFNYTGGNLTFTSGTHQASGALSNVPDIQSGMTVDLSSGGSFATSTTLDGGNLTTAAFDGTNLTTNSGSLTASGSLTNLPSITSGVSVDISGGGSFGDATTLDGGTVASGAFDYSSGNLTFTTGAHELSGALTNLNTLGANQGIVLDSSSATWSPTGDIDAGSVTLDGNAKLNVADYDASNLTFTDGDLTVTGTLTGLDSLSNTSQDIILDGGIWSTSGDLNFGNFPDLSENVTLKNGATLSLHDYTGYTMNGDLTGSGGGTLAVSGTLTAGTFESFNDADLTIDLTPGGQMVNTVFGYTYIQSGHLIINDGTVGTEEGDYYFDPTNSSSASLTVKGTLSGTLRSESNLTLVLDGGSHSTTSTNINALASVVIQNNGSLGVAAYDADALTFTDGTLTATGALTNLPTIAANNTVDISGGGSFGDATTLDGGQVNVANFNLASDNLTFTSGTLDTAGTLTVGSDNSTETLSGVISGSGILTKSGSGTTTLSGTNTYSGGTTISGGTLTGTTTSLQGDITNNAALAFDQDTDGTFSDVISGSGSLTKSGTGSLSLSGTNTYSGGTTVASGTLSLGSDSAAGTGTITTTGSVIDYADGVTIANAIDLQSDTTQLQVTTGSSATQSGVIGETGGARPLEKIGDGTLALTGTNTYTGGTTISAGTLSGTNANFGSGTITIDGGTLATTDFDATNLAFTSGSLTTTGALTNLNALTADQTVELNGGYWSPSGNIDAGDVILHNTGQLTVGDYDATNLAGVSGDHSNPASTLTTTGTLTNVNHAADLNIDVVLDGGTWADSTLTNGLAITIQNGGSLTTPADYDASLLTFTNGTLNTSGALTNLNSQSTGTGIVLDGGSWSPTGDIDDGSLTLQNAAALTIGDYDASNLTFTSGSITTDGALTNLNTLNANHTVTIDGASATWSPTDNIDAGTVNLTEGSLTLNTSFDAANLTFASTFSEPVALLTMNSGTLTNLNTLQVGQRVTLNGSSSWAPTGNIEAGETVLNSASATLTTTGDLDTRVVTFNAGTLAGDGVLSELPTIGSNMTVDLSSGGSLGTATTLDGGDLITADFDATLLTSTRGDLTASGAVSNLGTIGTNLNVDLTGGGSLPTATSLSGGNLRVADFDATQLSLSSGTLLATGDVSNLADIGSNLFVLMSSSAAFDTATTLDGGTVAISGSPGIYDFSANNLTFSSGTVSFFETNVANMPDITSGQIVELESTGFATTATLNGGEVELVDGIYDFNDLNFTFTAGTLTLSEAGLANLPAITTNQTVDITEGGFITTTFLAGGTLITDNFDEDDDVLFAFGTLQAYGAVHDLGSIINGQIVDISNGGSIEDLTTLDGGTLRVDDIDFDDEPVIFNAGTVVALGNVYLEDDLESGMILDITAGGELGGGADIIGGTLKTVDFDADGPSPTDFYEGTLSVTGELTNLDRLYGPDEGDGQTVILDGGTWSPDRGESDSDYINEGNVTIQNDGLLIVNGNYDATNLTFTHGTLTLTNEAELENLNTLGAGQTVVLDDAFWMAEGDINAGNIEMTNGSFLVANSGGGASTEFDATNLTFTSGGLAVEDQDLVNLNTVGTNQSVYLDNGSWAPSGSIDNADEIGLYNDASLTVGDYDASNLDFDSGTVTTTGSLTNLDTLGADNAVVIDGGEWLPTGGDISAGSVTVQNDGLLGVGTDFSTGTYDATNLTLTSGTLSSNHDITNLDTLGTGATVELLAEADWSPAGNIEAGTVKLNGGTLNVGDYDATNLPLSFDGADAGGTLVTTGTLTHLDSLTATLNVTLDGGTWNTTGDIDAGAVTVQNDGNLGVADYDATNLTLTAGTVTASGALTNLNTLSSSDQTVVLDGGSWSPTGSVGAGNVTLQNDGTLNVGDYDATRLTLSNGTVASDGSLTNLPTIAANTTIDLTLGGTLDSATTLDRGTINATELDATHLTFTSGTINVAGGPLTNLNTLGANQTVTLDNASWSTTGDIDNGHVTLTNNASLTVADYDTANLTFTSGTLEATGTLTHDQQLAANQTVRLNGTEATYDVGSDLQLSAGTVELTNGGTLSVGDHTATVLDAGTISFESGGGAIALDGGTLNLASLDGPFGLDADASITGNGSIFGNVNLGVGGTIDGDATGLEVFGHISGTGTLADLTLFGNIDIGNSPGDIYFENVDLSSESTIALAIEGPDLGQFDRLFVNASSDVSEATLQITFDSYTPASLALTFAIVSNDSGTDFASISTPEGWSLSNAGLLTYGASAVPEPGSFALLAGLATLGLAATRRRRSA